MGQPSKPDPVTSENWGHRASHVVVARPRYTEMLPAKRQGDGEAE